MICNTRRARSTSLLLQQLAVPTPGGIGKALILTHSPELHRESTAVEIEIERKKERL